MVEHKKITHSEMLNVLTNASALKGAVLTREEAEQFLSVLSASLEREIADRAPNPNDLQVEDWNKMPLRAGIVPVENLIDALAVGMGLSRARMRQCFEKLNEFLKNTLTELKPDIRKHIPIELEGFGTFIYSDKHGMMYYPVAFEYLRSRK